MSTVKTLAQQTDQAASQKARPACKPAWQAAFPTKKAYDESVASVVARIKSGEVQPRVPDEEEDDL